MARRLQLCVALCALCLVAGASAADNPPEWACSPPNTLAMACPKHLQGDPRCTAESCPAFAGCAGKDCKPVKGNIVADEVLALDAYAVASNGRCVRDSWSLPECCQLCQQTEGCNAWSYCNNPAGCGSGCDESKVGFRLDDLPDELESLNVTEWPKRFNPSHKCKGGGLWPQGVCSLKFVQPESLDAKRGPPLATGNQDGWVSGTVKLTAAAKAKAKPAKADLPAEARVLAAEKKNATANSTAAAATDAAPAPAPEPAPAPAAPAKSAAACSSIASALLLVASGAAAVLLL